MSEMGTCEGIGTCDGSPYEHYWNIGCKNWKPIQDATPEPRPDFDPEKVEAQMVIASPDTGMGFYLAVFRTDYDALLSLFRESEAKVAFYSVIVNGE